MMLRVVILLSSQILCLSLAFAQDIQVRGHFLKDSVRIGEEVRFSLAASHPSEINILFPDSTTSFFPFEYVNKKYFPTKTEGGVSYDSVLYFIRTFETERAQSLSLPVYVLHTADCTMLNTTLDSLLITSTLTNLPDTLSLNKLPILESVQYYPVQTRFNYKMAGLIGGLVILAALTAWIFFGQRVRQYFLLKRLQTNYQRFIQEYGNYLTQLSADASGSTAESTISVWKKYMESLERIPFTKLTTRETTRLIKDDVLTSNLHTIDRAIYGNHPVSIQPFEGLKAFAEQKFHKRLEEVKHG